MAFSQSLLGGVWGKLACGNHKNKLTTKCQRWAAFCGCTPEKGIPALAIYESHCFNSSNGMEGTKWNRNAPRTCFRSPEMGERSGQGSRWDHTAKMLSWSIKWPRLTCSGWLGMLGSLSTPESLGFWDSLRLYLFLVSSSDTWRQLSRWIGFVFTLSPRLGRESNPLTHSLSPPVPLVFKSQSAILILRRFSDDSAFVVTAGLGRSHFCQHRQLITRNCPDLRSDAEMARNPAKCWLCRRNVWDALCRSMDQIAHLIFMAENLPRRNLVIVMTVLERRSREDLLGWPLEWL